VKKTESPKMKLQSVGLVKHYQLMENSSSKRLLLKTYLLAGKHLVLTTQDLAQMKIRGSEMPQQAEVMMNS
jgi:hypothetical protein